MKIFEENGDLEQSAYFGWQDDITALCGIKEGYKNGADKLVEYVLEEGNNIANLDTFIFPIMYLYRHSIEISLKCIYQRMYGKTPKGGHDLLILWDAVKKDVIEKIICSEKKPCQIETADSNFFRYCFSEIKFNKIRFIIKELQKLDKNSEAWRYPKDKKGNLFFSNDNFANYTQIKEIMDYLYKNFDYIDDITFMYLSS